MSHKIHRIPTQEIRMCWPQVRAHLASAIEASNGRWNLEYVLASLVLNEYTLWVATKEEPKSSRDVVGAVVTQMVTYPGKRMLSIHFLGGENFADWYEVLLHDLSVYAIAMGCSGIEANARWGFWKYFKRDGFTKPSVFYEKEL